MCKNCMQIETQTTITRETRIVLQHYRYYILYLQLCLLTGFNPNMKPLNKTMVSTIHLC
jgi:hypothetical protein